MTDDRKTLPPIPASDEKSISANRFDTFYQVKSRDFWGANEIVREKPQAFKECNHFFIAKPNSAECKKCGFGLFGFFEVQNGKLFSKGEALGL